ncbi:hypothetical protein AAHA92_29324 [Salvia divinorum]|uniref:Uncharacterized protein n=1 Tax=Salvia divinorum TaxID=28513 RepID=A0ABD1FY16_SALDI
MLCILRFCYANRLAGYLITYERQEETVLYNSVTATLPPPNLPHRHLHLRPPLILLDYFPSVCCPLQFLQLSAFASKLHELDVDGDCGRQYLLD